MTYRIPYLAVTGPGGIDQLEAWGQYGQRLVGVKIVSRLFDESDTCAFTFRNGPPYIPAPAENTPFSVKVGWSAADAALVGVFYMHSIHLSGSPKDGEQVTFECFSGKMADLDKVGSQHFNANNGHKTLEDVFKTVLSNTGMAVEVAASIAGLPLPGGHLIQWNQSAIDFATDLANNAGAIVKPSGGKIIVLGRRDATSVGGQPLAPVTIDHADCYNYDVSIDPRFQYQSISVPYTDDGTGRLNIDTTTGSAGAGGSGAQSGLPHPAADQASAQTLGKAVLDEFHRFTGTGIFEVVGNAAATYASRPTFTNFPDPIGTTKWIAVEVTHDVTPDEGWITTIETQTDAD